MIMGGKQLPDYQNSGGGQEQDAAQMDAATGEVEQ